MLMAESEGSGNIFNSYNITSLWNNVTSTWLHICIKHLYKCVCDVTCLEERCWQFHPKWKRMQELISMTKEEIFFLCPNHFLKLSVWLLMKTEYLEEISLNIGTHRSACMLVEKTRVSWYQLSNKYSWTEYRLYKR